MRSSFIARAIAPGKTNSRDKRVMGWGGHTCPNAQPFYLDRAAMSYGWASEAIHQIEFAQKWGRLGFSFIVSLIWR